MELAHEASNGIATASMVVLAALMMLTAGMLGVAAVQAWLFLTQLRLMKKSMEVAEAAAFLLSDAARGITGEVLLVDAGFHATGM